MFSGTLYKSECPKCGNVDILSENETEEVVHCQRCYHHYSYGKE